MKKFRRIMALLIAAVMVMSMGAVAFADEAPTTEKTTIQVKVNDNEHADFYAIPIFLGTQDSTNDDMALTEIRWADEAKAGALTEAIAKVVPAAAEKTTATDVAKAISDANLDSAGAEKLAKAIYDVLKTESGTKLSNNGVNEVPVGWYLVVDKSELGDNDALNAAVLQFTRDITIQKKTDAPSQEKKVKEDTTYTGQDAHNQAKYNDVADYDIGEDVPFHIYSKIPDISKYTKYEMTFTDTMDAGLTLNEDSIEVKIGEKTYKKGENNNVIITKTDAGFTVKLIVKKQSEDKLSGTNTDIYAEAADITVAFTAKLNKNAVIGLPGNVNTSKLTYTNSPNATDENDSTKDTPEDKVIVFTYELDVTKVDGSDSTKGLKDAEFVMKNADGKFLKVDADGKVEGWVDSQGDASVLKSGADGKFKVIGLDEGTYALKETKAPTNYNLRTTDIPLVITATYIDDRQAWDSFEADEALLTLDLTADGEEIEGAVDTGIVATNIINNEGTVLPSTGGIGTTIFYILGAALAIGAGVMLVTRRRMNVQ